ncbi:hypothetical protein HU200_035277 [Digitaria exilis]|uniref:non-specific serine/threonine protein kinase n=1 Tax=Digitaria exilis TaxID=1010633 RepID=A0A835BHT7_9POAL|nr:hypothetical protein HU200_035277 [Digitaria exilis]
MDYNENEVEDLERVYRDVNAEPIQIPYAVVKSITKNFTQEIGHGAFGVVYLGALRNGLLVAVKKLFPSMDFSERQFVEEVRCLKKIKHNNIVRFLGYCADTQGIIMEVEGKQTIGEIQQRFICLEYVPNGSLDNYIKEKTHGYGWNTRYQIIKGICQGLHYLQQIPMYHLDLKPANVLLGAKMEPKISDFGLSRCIDGDQFTIFTTHVQGTPGYIPPEHIHDGKISLKSDIFSLGIIMTRLLIGSMDIIPENVRIYLTFLVTILHNFLMYSVFDTRNFYVAY